MFWPSDKLGQNLVLPPKLDFYVKLFTEANFFDIHVLVSPYWAKDEWRAHTRWRKGLLTCLSPGGASEWVPTRARLELSILR